MPDGRIIPKSIVALAGVATLQIGALAKFAALVEAIVAALINILAAITLIIARGAILANVGSQRVDTCATFVTDLIKQSWTGVQVTLINVLAVRPISKHAWLAGASEGTKRVGANGIRVTVVRVLRTLVHVEDNSDCIAFVDSISSKPGITGTRVGSAIDGTSSIGVAFAQAPLPRYQQQVAIFRCG
jgi:hypothetical protein